ncbi:pantoate--beta-alanine ligase [Pseudoalteromonas piratica]|uniref:Pantothenate synthetase n=1 Tax=Pseudoalteromonas piratica TaxID=1348114 RepID=A0A0A7EDW1_9GAMM|nr:pantoate--beta-alanine ligase [Pseudoalteromonas piratica]AIY64718.1 pantoate--beta-alanine ligase [Pseudoalteromonas piratica]
MQTVSNVSQLRSKIKSWKQQGLTVAFVPTMGNLHAGHFSLVDKAKQIADKVVVSIFVNPMQFGKNEDLDKYPRTLVDDQNGLIEHGADLLFTPTVETIYPKGLEAQSYIDVPGVSEGHCGASRPGHFRGVATIVNKLFNLVQPDIACFGEKDFQQLAVIKTMVEDLSMPIEIIGVATKREESGLAMSSRNGYLSDEEKQQACALYQIMKNAESALKDGELSIAEITEQAHLAIVQHGFKLDYFNICNANTLQPATNDDTNLVILVAAFLANVRLIDNLQVTTA